MHGRNHRPSCCRAWWRYHRPEAAVQPLEQKLVSDKTQRYNRSRERYNRWAETVSRKDRGRNKEKLSLSHTTEEDKGGVRNVYVKKFPQYFLMRIPS